MENCSAAISPLRPVAEIPKTPEIPVLDFGGFWILNYVGARFAGCSSMPPRSGPAERRLAARPRRYRSRLASDCALPTESPPPVQELHPPDTSAARLELLARRRTGSQTQPHHSSGAPGAVVAAVTGPRPPASWPGNRGLRRAPGRRSGRRGRATSARRKSRGAGRAGGGAAPPPSRQAKRPPPLRPPARG